MGVNCIPTRKHRHHLLVQARGGMEGDGRSSEVYLPLTVWRQTPRSQSNHCSRIHHICCASNRCLRSHAPARVQYVLRRTRWRSPGQRSRPPGVVGERRVIGRSCTASQRPVGWRIGWNTRRTSVWCPRWICGGIPGQTPPQSRTSPTCRSPTLSLLPFPSSSLNIVLREICFNR